MAVQSLADLVRDPQTRIGRAVLLLDEHGDEIERVAHDLYMVPSCSGTDTYRVRYGGDVETCECSNFAFHGDEEPCKHILSVAISRAKRRGAAR
jgi:hypothetical protein